MTTDRSTASTNQGGTRATYLEVRDLGIWYRRRRYRSYSMRQVLTGRAWRDRSQVFWALRNVDLVCREGEVLGIIGPNGAGKSTLCLVLAGILSPDEGEAIVRGRVSALLSLGAGLQKDLTGRENIVLNAAFLGITRRRLQRQLDDIIEFAELAPVIDQPVRTYSSGMLARLGFAVAASLQPEVLILDEVLSVGDIAFRQRSERRIREMIAGSKLIIIVSHELELLRGLCNRCLWLEAGRVREHGDAAQVLDAFERSMSAG
jgi:ABC-type polysaccharide/polyol phosphate transport system ATPase subunit